ncbi:MAG TPA: hypothetical protein VJZ00_18765, partial [Thermoanaerobaculia bacterium]|nr:hypothetical protein [Thermoanaerobaculia bacterium]
MIRVVSLIVLASLALPSAAAGRRVLLAWLHDEKAIEPIVMLDPLTKAMVRPREDFAFARSYTLSIDGKESGTVRTGERTELGCVSIAAKAEVKGDGNFATNFAPRAAGSIREATADETRRMRRWARQFLVQRGIPKASAEKIEAVFD